MAQVLVREKQAFEVDRIFRDDGEPPIFNMIGNQRHQIKAAVPPRPEIWQRGEQFFYCNGKPVDKPGDVAHLPEPFKSQALTFIGASGTPGRSVKRLKPVKGPALSPAQAVERVIEHHKAVKESARKTKFDVRTALGRDALRRPARV